MRLGSLRRARAALRSRKPRAHARSVGRGAVSVRCFDEFRRRVATMPARVPQTTEGSEWQRMLEKDTSVMTYRAWRHNLPVRRGAARGSRRAARATQRAAALLPYLRKIWLARGARRTARPFVCAARSACWAGSAARRLVARGACAARWAHPIVSSSNCPTLMWRRLHLLSPAQSGGAEYLSVTVFEGATPLDLVEFFCDDAHRMTWCVRGHFKPSR